ncbi:MAG: hypothetical protein KGN01_05410 [Patescibacteria group bacterium]|nr:hypothetical protein [Patescibacteria group bacterium]
MMAQDNANRDIMLSPGSYLYLMNIGQGGTTMVHIGPTVVNQTPQDQAVKYDSTNNKFVKCTLEEAVQYSPRVKDGDYLILENPAADGSFPTSQKQQTVPLDIGRKEIIAGPWSKALWPGQTATVVQGHRLRSKDYLVVVVYNEEAAAANWTSSLVSSEEEAGLPRPKSFAVGTRIVIKGTEVSFFIPCTGVEVVKDERGNYVREAVTLEQMQYCILLGENGKKEYPKGPDVIFPSPTQTFEKNAEGQIKFKPLELNALSGIYVKVTADFGDIDFENPGDNIREYIEGEELFITGETLSIYYPREQLSIIKYGEQEKHHATVIPKGEARYVMHRESGIITKIEGPLAYLPDPRHEVFVKRVLSSTQCSLWYPSNAEALAYNAEQEVEQKTSGNILLAANYLAPVGPTQSNTITRGTSYTPPRQITLDTKYEGAPKIDVWPGYAVLVVGAAGSRRVVKGPQTVLLEYDEVLGHMELSTGKPKSTDNLLKTVYLNTDNNQVTDYIPFESSDHVKGTVKLSLRVNFEGESDEERLKWFSVANYVKLLCDHVRSIIAGMGKRHPIAEIKNNYINLIRDAILGPKAEGPRPGLPFGNGMRVIEVEVLKLELLSPAIEQLLDKAQLDVVTSNIDLESAKRNLQITLEKETIAREIEDIKQETQQLAYSAKQQTLEQNILAEKDTYSARIQLKSVESQLSLAVLNGKLEELKRNLDLKQLEFDMTMAQRRVEEEFVSQHNIAEQDLELQLLKAETQAAISRMEAVQGPLTELMTALTREDLAAKFAEASNMERVLTGSDNVDAILAASPLLRKFMEKGGEVAKLIAGNNE